MSYFLRLRILRLPYVELILMGGFLFNSLLTFTRGGAIINAMQTLAMYVSSVRSGLARFKTAVVTTLGTVIILYVATSLVDDLTGGLLEQRFLQGIMESPDNQLSEEKKLGQLTSGRYQLLISDLTIFYHNLLTGVGPGLSKRVRALYSTDLTGHLAHATAHSEPSRLLAEHGLMGLSVLILLIILPWRYYRTLTNPHNKLIFIGFIMFATFFFFHSAMRTGAIVLGYALAFIRTELPKFTLKRRRRND